MTGSETQSKRSCLSGAAPLVIAVLLACAVLWYLLPVPREAGPVAPGDSVDTMRNRMGPPDSEVTAIVPSSWEGYRGSRPKQLKPGQTYTVAHYRNHDGQDMHVFLVSPEVYEKVTGTPPGTAKLYVLEISTRKVDTAQ